MMVLAYIFIVIFFIAVFLVLLIRKYGPRSSRVLKSGMEFTIHGNKRIMGDFNISKNIYLMKDHVLDDFYDLIKYSDYILTKHDIPYTAAYGSLLGAVRHGGIMPWDDDADFFIHVPVEKYDELLAPLSQEIKNDGFQLRKSYDADYFHMCKIGASNHYPYIDWYQYMGTFQKSDLYPIKRVPYEDFEICVPNDPIACVNAHYGSTDPLSTIVCNYPFKRYYSLWITQLLKRFPGMHQFLDRVAKVFIKDTL
jgi:hypothetical protein